jgi:transposase
MAFIRKIKKGASTYLAKVESYREDGKVKQRVIEYVGKEENGVAIQKVDVNKLQVTNVKHYGDVSVIYQLCKQLNLNYLLGKHHKSILALLIAHLVCKGSILRISEWIDQSTIKETVGLDEISIEMLYNSLDYLEDCDFDKIEQALFEQWNKIAPSDNKAYVLDVTDTYYNGKDDATLVRKGKDGKVSKLIQIGLAVSFDNGFPILHKSFNGNMSNIKILEDIMQTIAKRGLKTIVLDRGFYSEANVTDMNKLKMKMIVGVKQSIGIKNNILSKINRDEMYIKKNLIQLKNTVVYAKEQDFLFGKLIVIYNPKYEVMKKDKMLADDASDADVKYVGYSLLFHNTNLAIDQVVKKYFDKDIVERSFRTMKGEVQLHPIRLWLPNRVNAHVKICYLSMCVLSLMQYRCSNLNLSPSEILNEIKSIYKINLKHSSTKAAITKVVTQSNLQKKILTKLKCSV